MTNNDSDDYRSDDERLADSIADGLRNLADMVEDHSHLAEHLRYTALNGGSPISVPIGYDIPNPQAVADAFRDAGQASGATITDRDSGEWQGTVIMFGPVGIFVYASAERMQAAAVGRIRRNAAGQILGLRASEIEVLTAPAEAPPLAAIVGADLDFTGGEAPRAYLEELRGEREAAS